MIQTFLESASLTNADKQLFEKQILVGFCGINNFLEILETPNVNDPYIPCSTTLSALPDKPEGCRPKGACV